MVTRETSGAMMTDGGHKGEDSGQSPLFIVSGRNAAALADAASSDGWNAETARFDDDVEGAFLRSGAIIIVVDGRTNPAAAREAVRRLADAAEINAAALLVLVPKRDQALIADALVSGATHYLVAPCANGAFCHSLRYAERHAIRLAGGWGLIERRRAERPATVEQAARTLAGARDALTGVRDSASARRWVGARLTSGRGPFHIMLFAITRFEMINTAFGRETGDAILQAVARIVTPLAQELGGRRVLVARTSGAEFVIGLPDDHDGSRSRILADQISDQLERPMLAGLHLVTLSTRTVIVESASADRDAADLLRRASLALADAKGQSSDHVVHIGESGRTTRLFDDALQSDLRRALDRDEIDILFQPQVSVTSGRIIGVEALARWQHPVHGELGALTLFAVAEQSDYLLALSAHVQQRAISRAAQWPETLAKLRLSVNITTVDMARAGFADSFLAMVDRIGFPRARLTVEITESGLMEDLSLGATLLADLRAGGCRVAIDDFGTGYSSLAWLKALPLDYLKIDQKLAQDITGSTRDRIVVRGVIDMARALGLAVIAEGVETEEQLALLAREGCNYYQGFLCAEPLTAPALVALVADESARRA